MSNYTIEISGNQPYHIEVDNSELQTPINLEIIKANDNTVEISSLNTFLTFDTPSGYPIAHTSGILSIDRVASGYLIENLTSGNTLVRTFGDQTIDGLKIFNSGSFQSLKVGSFDVSVSGHTHIISNIAGLQTALDAKQGSGNYALSSHTHTSSNITDFNTSVDSRITNANLQPSGNYSVVGHTHTISNVTGLQTALDNKQASGNYSLTGHTHNISDITSLQTALDNKQPSGNYALSSHTHTSSNITDFNSSISGLLPVKNISNGSYISVSSISGNYTISATGLQPSGSYSLSNHTHSSFTSLNLGSPNLETCLNISVPSSYGTNQYQDTSVLQITNDDLASTVFAIDGLGQIRYGTIDSTNVNGLNDAITAQIPTTIVYTSGNQNISGVKTFNNNVNISGLLTSVSGNFTNSLKINGTDVSISGHTHAISSITGLQTALDNKQPSGSYASSSHTHSSSDITNFNTSVSGLVNGIYAPLSSPSLTGTPLTPTANAGTNNTQIASTAFVRTEISNLVASAPTALDTLNELATALGNDANFSTTVTNNLAGKANLSGATFTGSISGPSGNFTSLKVNGVDVSASGHTHTASNITDFNSAVSGLIPTFSTELDVYVKNATGGNLYKGQVVYINGAQGDHPTITLAIASGEMTSSKTLGLLKQDLLVNEFGYVVSEGTLDGIDTSNANVAGDTMWLSPTVSGGIVYGLSNKPSAPNHMVFLGYVLRKQLNNGKVYVKVQNGYELEELHNVAISGVTNGQFLQYNNSNGLWIPSSSGNFTSLSVNSTGVSVNGHTHTSSNITDFNSSVSGLLPVKNISNGGYLSVSSTIGNYTISVTGLQPSGNYSLVGHTHTISDVTNLQTVLDGKQPSGNYAASSHTHTASQITDFNTSVDSRITSANLQPSGNYSLIGHTHTSSNITDFNSSVSGLLTPYQLTLTNPVTGTGTTSYVPKWSGSSGLSNSLIYDNGTNVGIGNNTPSYRLDVTGSGIFRGTGSSIVLNADGNVAGSPSIDATSTYSDINIKVGGQNIFRGLDGWTGTWADSAATTYFQVGRQAGNTIFSSLVGSNFNRLGFASSKTLFTNSTSSIAIPSGYFNIVKNSSNLFTVMDDGKVGIGTASPSSQLHVIGSGVISSGLIVNGNLTFDSYTESVVSNGDSGTGKTLSLTSGTVHTCTLTGNCTFTMPTATAGKSFSMFLNSGSGNYTASFSGVRWADSATPTATITASKVDIYSFISDGSFWYGSFSQNYG